MNKKRFINIAVIILIISVMPMGQIKASDTPNKKFLMFVDRLAREEYGAGDKRQFAFIKNVYEKSGNVYIDADYFRWLSINDGSCITGGTSQPASNVQKIPECNPNGFLIVNDNPKIRTFKLSPGVKVRLLEEFGNVPDLHTRSPQEFMNGHNKFGEKLYVYAGENYKEPYYVPFLLILKGGKIIFIHQLYVC